MRIGSWLIDAERLTVERDDDVQRLRPKDMAVLLELAINAPAVVARSSLIDAVWPRGFVDPAVLNNAVSRLRRILDTDNNTIIETIPRQGYRIAAPVSLDIADDGTRWTAGSPFRGLEAFSADFAQVFFGRNRDIAQILRILETQAGNGRSFVLLLGASGSGKTSLINAGVIPELESASGTALDADWLPAPFETFDNTKPWDTLANALENALRPTAEQALDWGSLAADLEHRSGEAIATLVTALQRLDDGRPARILLVIDHLEQTLINADTRADLQLFFDTIHKMARCGRVWIIAGLRSDFYQEYNRFPALAALKREAGQFDVITPNAEQFGAIVREPAQAAGLSFEVDRNTGVSLDSVLLARSMEQTDALPMLQFTLNELYNRRDENNCLTLDAYDAMGGLEGSIARRAEECFSSLDEKAQGELPIVLNAMVRLSGRDNLRHSRRHASVAALSEVPARKRLLDAFVDGRVFVSRYIDGEAVASVAHEALFDHWDRARSVMTESHQLLLVSKRLTQAAQTWEQQERSGSYLIGAGPLHESERLQHSNLITLKSDERDLIRASRNRVNRNARLKQLTLASLAAFAIVAAAAAGIAVLKRQEADQQALRATQTTQFLVRLFELANPGQSQSDNLTAQQVLDLGAQELSGHLNQQPGVRSALLQTMGNVYTNLGLYDRARPMIEEALQIRESAPGSATELTETLASLGKVNYYQGDYEAAATFYERATDTVQSSGLSGTAIHAQTLNNQGENAAALGEYDTAIRFHEQALEIRRVLFGDTHAETGTSLQNLAGTLRRNGALDEAEAHYRQALAIHESVYGPAHPEVAVALGNLGLLLTDLERFDEARPLLQRALDIRREVYGNEHPHTANSLHNLSALLFRQSEYADAEPVFRESLALHEKLFGGDHDAVAYGRNNLATLLLKTERSMEAQELYGKALASLKGKLGPSHPNTALIEGNFARANLANGNVPVAIAHVESSIRVLQEALPPGHWRLAVMRGLYGSALLADGQVSKAEAELTVAWEALVASHGEDAEVTQEVVESLIETHMAAGNQSQVQRFVAMRK